MEIRKAPETVTSGSPSSEANKKDQVYEIVKENVESFTLSQLDQEIEQLQRNIDAFQYQINELQAKKAQALAIDVIKEEPKPEEEVIP